MGGGPPAWLCKQQAINHPSTQLPPTVRSLAPLPGKQSMAYVGRCNPELLPALYRWTAAVLPALASHLRTQQHYLDDHLGSVLDGAELEWLRHRTNPAIAALQVGWLAGQRGLERSMHGACHFRGAGRLDRLHTLIEGDSAVPPRWLAPASRPQLPSLRPPPPTALVHPPLERPQVLSSLLSRADLLCPFERQQIEALVSHLDVVVGGCERM